jgi:hypothetical protein
MQQHSQLLAHLEQPSNEYLEQPQMPIYISNTQIELGVFFDQSSQDARRTT